MKRRLPSGNLVLLVLLGIGVSLMLLLLGMRFMLQQMFGTGPAPAGSLAQLSEKTNVAFPPGSELIDGEICHCWVPWAYARVSIPPERVPQFWKQSLFSDPPLPPQSGSLDNMVSVVARNRWKLWKLKDCRYNSGGDMYQGGAVEALLSLDDPNRPVLHLYWYAN
jgi:hypothetical protein